LADASSDLIDLKEPFQVIDVILMCDFPPFLAEKSDICKLPRCILVKACVASRRVLNASEGLEDTPELVLNKEDIF
jgi:hypothetical protein